jgi:hypothetical protein
MILERNTDLEAAKVAQSEFASESVLSDAGGDVWRRLWEAARSYSESHAYQSEPFPFADGSVCLLCQQPLTDNAGQRLHSFENFVQSDLQIRATRSSGQVATLMIVVDQLDLPTWNRIDLAKVGINSKSTQEDIRRFLAGAKLRRRHMRRFVNNPNPDDLPDLPPPPQLDEHLLANRERAQQLRADSRSSERSTIMTERQELMDRIAIAPYADVIKGEIDRLKLVSAVDSAISKCRTNRITLEGRKASTAVITDRLRANFAVNLREVGFSGTPVEFEIWAGSYGEHPYQVKLMPRPEIPPGNVLSEGERTCVALAGFLSELDTTGNDSAIVIDDPVSSLDHQYRKSVAERLIIEARSRQVILLTHDVVFLFLLQKYSGELSVSLTEMTLERGYRQNHGVAT